MPRKRKITRKISSDRVTAGLRTSIAAGIPWRSPRTTAEYFGHSDLVALVKGHFYFEEFCHRDDDNSQRVLWESLRNDLLSQHIPSWPGTRPWAWWKFEATELRRNLGPDWDDEDETGQLDPRDYPQDSNGNLKRRFGRPCIFDGCRYETQEEYLRRLKLLTPEEKKRLDKFELMSVKWTLYVPRCQPCWRKVEKKVATLRFDFNNVAERSDPFYVPADLLFPCEHKPLYTGEDGVIFQPRYEP